MPLHSQRGALSLLGCAVLFALFTLAAVVALFSMRHERNVFADVWSRLMHASGAESVPLGGDSVKSESAVIRKCIVHGMTVYSNVDCDRKNPTGRVVELHDAQGFEAPKPSPVPAADTRQNVREKMIEKAIAR